MAKQKVILGPHQPQIEVSPQALTSQLALFSPSFLSSYVSLSSKNPNLTPWQLSCQHQVQVTVEKMQELIDKKESHDINVELLKNAIEKGEVEKVKILLNTHIQKKLSNEEAEQLVRIAILRKQYETLETLVESDTIDINSGVQQGTVLHSIIWAVHEAYDQNIDIETSEIEKSVNALFKRGIDVNIIAKGNAPIDLAIGGGNAFPILDALLKHPNIDVNSASTDNIPIIVAIQTQDYQAFDALLKHPNINVNIMREYGIMTPMAFTIRNDNMQMFNALLKHPNINVNNKGSDRYTLLHCAIENNNQPAVEALLNHPNIDVNNKDNDTHMTPLHDAIATNNQLAFNALLKHPDIDLNGKIYDRMTPLDYAVSLNRLDMVKGLLQHEKIDPKLLDSALLYVQSPEVLKLLLDNNADIHEKVGGQSFYERCESNQNFQQQKEWFDEYQLSLKACLDGATLPEVPDSGTLVHIGEEAAEHGD